MSVVYQWPVAFLKQWIQPISYVIGFDYNYNIVPILNWSASYSFAGGNINFSVLFRYPVVLVYAFSYVYGSATYPIQIFLDYPTYSLVMRINISP